tara:strand:- start:698 stop:994 length:297 start_codon:yes stop_codon:yes gene_type:complete
MIDALKLDLPSDYSVEVHTTNNRGFTPEEVAHHCANKIISISNNTHPGIQAQAYAFKGHIEKTIAFYMREAIKSDRTTVYNALMDAGHPELAESIRRL